ncbi:unnamed protein product [Dracunculus medinensis]|uniref:Translation factor GUF1 homolog, mitochondrial n=1 Tax=Dracunculus medinensis TaxID=318479 RepID=A0A0N4U562_DRAME|nr:unnamed protein product [Dracunculus medinensis]
MYNISPKSAALLMRRREKIRNFGIVAHVDHGKSTLADRILESAGIFDSEHESQILDTLQVERERGITVKAQTCTMIYKDHLLNLIDTPGHVDFNYEVCRSLAVSDGILFIVAANQGIQAQTVTNFWLAFERDVTIIPIINKIDMKDVDLELVKKQMINLFEFNLSDFLLISAKYRTNIPLLLDAIIERVPCPKVDYNAPFRSLIFDSWYDKYIGAIVLVLVKEGSVTRGQKISSFLNKKEYEVHEVGIMHPNMLPVESLYAGQIGYIVTRMTSVKEAAVGDTLFDYSSKAVIVPVSGFKPAKPTIYSGLFPVDGNDYDSLKQAVERLALNDPSVSISGDSSPALGLGWRIGFSGMLHMEVFGARLEQEHKANVILTYPSIEFRAIIKDNQTVRKKRYEGKSEISVVDASKFPDPSDVEKFLQPMVKLTIIMPCKYLWPVKSLCKQANGVFNEVSYIDETRVMLQSHLPLAKVIVGFFEDLKRITSGFASFDYEHDGYEEVNLIKLVISINDKPVDEFSQVLIASQAKNRAQLIVQHLKKEIPRQQFEVIIKATIGTSSKIIAQARISPIKKDFTQTLKGNFGGGGDRFKKKLADQKDGKARLKLLGKVAIPKEAFINFLKN